MVYAKKEQLQLYLTFCFKCVRPTYDLYRENKKQKKIENSTKIFTLYECKKNSYLILFLYIVLQ